VIANRNQAHFLRAAIDSALAEQTVGVEVLVVDDGSTDDSLSLLATYGASISVLQGEGRGACRARNIGLGACRKPYVKFLDADDYLLPGALADQVRSLETMPGARVSVFGDVLWVDETGQPIAQPQSAAASIRLGESFVLHAPLTSAPLHRTALVREVGGFDERVPRGQEHDLHVRMWLHGVEFRHQPGNVYCYRQHAGPRISSRDGEAAVAEGRLESLRRHVALAKERFGSPLPPQLARGFAIYLWKNGRRVAQQGNASIARQYFQDARNLDPATSHGRPLYRWLCAAFGPIAAERILQALR
jgi:glycosyltransferase involved in cell wall biosynthesis